MRKARERRRPRAARLGVGRSETPVDDAADQHADQRSDHSQQRPNLAADRTGREGDEHSGTKGRRSHRVPGSADPRVGGCNSGTSVGRLPEFAVPLRLETLNKFGLRLIGQVIDELDELVACGHRRRKGLCRIGTSLFDTPTRIAQGKAEYRR